MDGVLAGYESSYGAFMAEMRNAFDEFMTTGRLEDAHQLSLATGQHFNWSRPPHYFTGELDADVVLIHLNPKHDDDYSDTYAGTYEFTDFESYFNAHRYFGRRMYGSGSEQVHKSPFDHKQVVFLRELGVIDFVDESTREHRYINLERAVDRKLQLELIPFGSSSFSTRGLTPSVLAPHFARILGVIAAVPRQYVLFCGRVFEPLLEEYVVEQQKFHLRKKDGSPERQTSRFAKLAIQFNGMSIEAGLCHSWSRQGIPMSEYGREIAARY